MNSVTVRIVDGDHARHFRFDGKNARKVAKDVLKSELAYYGIFTHEFDSVRSIRCRRTEFKCNDRLIIVYTEHTIF